MSLQKQRIVSIDILRGIVMLIRRLTIYGSIFISPFFTDSPANLANTTPALFITRWITHFCAPVFVFFSGTSAFLAAQHKTLHQSSLFLLKRGAWLIIAEIAIITFLFRPQQFGFGLPAVYAIWLPVILLFYKPCQWFDRYRSTHRQWWLSYL